MEALTTAPDPESGLARLRGAVERLRAHGVPFLVNSSFSRRNQREIPAVYELAKRLGATAWYLFMIVPTGRAADIIARCHAFGSSLLDEPPFSPSAADSI